MFNLNIKKATIDEFLIVHCDCIPTFYGTFLSVECEKDYKFYSNTAILKFLRVKVLLNYTCFIFSFIIRQSIARINLYFMKLKKNVTLMIYTRIRAGAWLRADAS